MVKNFHVQKTSWEVVYVPQVRDERDEITCSQSLGRAWRNHMLTIPSRSLDSPRSNLNLGRTCATISSDVFTHHFHMTDFFFSVFDRKYHRGIPLHIYFVYYESERKKKVEKTRNLQWEAGELERTKNLFLHHG